MKKPRLRVAFSNDLVSIYAVGELSMKVDCGFHRENIGRKAFNDALKAVRYAI
jgi:hypothetical protein